MKTEKKTLTMECPFLKRESYIYNCCRVSGKDTAMISLTTSSDVTFSPYEFPVFLSEILLIIGSIKLTVLELINVSRFLS